MNTNGKYYKEPEGQPLGYEKAIGAWRDWTPKDGFQTAGPDEEILQRPASHILIAVEGPGEVYVNGMKIQPAKSYADADVYEFISIGQSMSGKCPGIMSLKISEGTRYRYYVTGSLGACVPWIQ